MIRQSAASCLVVALALAASINSLPSESLAGAPGAPTEAIVGALQAAQAEPQQEESYQRVYEAFTKLMQNINNNSLGNARRLVSRLNQLVGGNPTESKPAAEQPKQPQPQQQVKQQQSHEEAQTEQILNRLDKVTKETDQHTLSKLNEDVNRLVGTLSESYLRNIRRVIERVNRTIGSPASSTAITAGGGALHQSGDRFEDPPGRQPGFPGWDELIVAVDRVQKSLANFVRSSTKLITSGR